MKTIPLSQGKFTSVDADVYVWASEFKWHVHKSGRRFYAMRHASQKFGAKSRKLYLHREIMRPGEGFEVHHINGDGLNNCRENLRNVTSHQNHVGYARKARATTSRFRGVNWYKRTRKWRAYIFIGNKHVHLGYFGTEEGAANARDSAVRKAFGKFAHCNIV